MLQRTLKFKIVKSLLLFFALITYGCSHQNISKEAERLRVLEDMKEYIQSLSGRERKDQLIALMDLIKKDMEVLNQSIQKFGSESKVLFSDYDATPGDFEKLFKAFNNTRMTLQKGILTSYFKMKELTSAEEWKELSKLEEKAFFDGDGQTILDSRI